MSCAISQAKCLYLSICLIISSCMHVCVCVCVCVCVWTITLTYVTTSIVKVLYLVM